MSDKRASKSIIFLVVAIVFGVGTYMGLSYFWGTTGENVAKLDTGNRLDANEKVGKDGLVVEADLSEASELISDMEVVKPSADDIAERMGMDMKFDDPDELVNQILKKMSEIDSDRDIEDLARVLGNGQVDQRQLAMLNELYGENRMKLREGRAIELLGEVKAGKVSRWALHLQDGSEIKLQATKQKDGMWKVDQVVLPLSNKDANGVPLTVEQIEKRNADLEAKDSLLFSHQFLKALIEQDFEKARMMANDGKVSDAKIAGLCILFEDGSYKMNENKPLQAVRMTERMAAFYVNVKSGDDSDAQFSVNVVRDGVHLPWKIDEVNLDRLLEDYAQRVAGGDVYYTPLINNPNGGDMLVIYFEFDSNGLVDRTKKQLGIVAHLLKLDQSKKVRLSGHTDGLGSDAYNQGLSENRAVAVKKFLTEQGIKAEQIVTEAHGFSKPRRQEQTTMDGADDPNARRANRRTEIYLDF